MRFRQIGVAVADIWIQTDGGERGVNQIAVNEDLFLSPGFPGVPENAVKSLRARGENLS